MKDKIKTSLKAKFLGENIPSNNKQKDVIVLAIGFAFLIGVFIFARVNYHPNNNQSSNNEVKEEINFKNLDELFNSIGTNYNYNITILNKNNSAYSYFNGSVDNNVNIGKKIIDTVTINYKIDSNGAINTTTNEAITNLYDGFLYYFFTPSNVFDYVKDLENTYEILDDKKIYNYNSKYRDDNIVFKITTTVDKIEKISYIYDNIEYSIMISRGDSNE